jgi:hypothetical protein
MIYKFLINRNGKTFECERAVSGNEILQQTVTVSGIGSKTDAARYGKKMKNGLTMEFVARSIALAIIEKQESEEKVII